MCLQNQTVVINLSYILFLFCARCVAATQSIMKLLRLCDKVCFQPCYLLCYLFAIVFVILPFPCLSEESDESYISNYDTDITHSTYEDFLQNNIPKYTYSKAIELGVPPDAPEVSREKRQAKKNRDESFRQLNIPQIDIPFRDMATFVTEAEKSINERLEVLEPKIYRSSARQIPKSPEWFMSASSKIKVIAKNMSRVALICKYVAHT